MNGKRLVPGQRLAERPMSGVAPAAALRRLGYRRGENCPRGIRAIASTLSNQWSFPAGWIEKRLGSGERDGVLVASNHADRLLQRREMTRKWADCLGGLGQRKR